MHALKRYKNTDTALTDFARGQDVPAEIVTGQRFGSQPKTKSHMHSYRQQVKNGGQGPIEKAILGQINLELDLNDFSLARFSR